MIAYYSLLISVLCLSLDVLGRPSQPKGCTSSEFKCADNRTCISKGKVNDGTEDCADGSDEGAREEYAINVGCQSWEVACWDSTDSAGISDCIDKEWVCDGIRDCPNYEDELDCDHSSKCLEEEDKLACMNPDICFSRR